MAGTWTYDVTAFTSTEPSALYPTATKGNRYLIRLLINDTNSAIPLFFDEEIDVMQTLEANTYCAAAALCESLTTIKGNVATKKVGELSITYNPKFYRDLAGMLRARGAGHQIPYAGGISVADKMAFASNTDYTQSSVQRGLDDNPAAPQPALPQTTPLTTL